MHLKKFRTAKIWSTLLLTGLLGACGGGDETSGEASDQAEAGAVETIEIRSDGELMAQEHYSYWEVSKDGVLSAAPLSTDQATGHLLPVLTEAKYHERWLDREAVVPEAQAFFTQLWNALSEHHGGRLSAEQLIAQFQDFDASLELLYADLKNSGLALEDYVALYEALDTAFASDTDELLLREFLKRDINGRQFVEALKAQGLTPAEFFAQMRDQGLTLSDVATHFAQLTGAASQSSNTLHASVHGLKGFVDQIVKIFTALWELMKFLVVGNHKVLPFDWKPSFNDITAGVPVSTNTLHYKSSLNLRLTKVTLWEFSLQLNATTQAQSAEHWMSSMVKDVQVKVTDQKSRAGNAWGLAMTGTEVLKPPSMRVCDTDWLNLSHVVYLAGGAQVQSGITKRTYVFTSVLSGETGKQGQSPWTLEGREMSFKAFEDEMKAKQAAAEAEAQEACKKS